MIFIATMPICIQIFIVDTRANHNGYQWFHRVCVIQHQTLLNSLLKYCKFQQFNRLYGCTVTDCVNLLFLYHNRVFNRHGNCSVGSVHDTLTLHNMPLTSSTIVPSTSESTSQKKRAPSLFLQLLQTLLTAIDY